VPKAARQQRILELIARNRVESQEQLLDLLQAEGVECAQSTVSRDLRELGLYKTEAGYRARHAAGAAPAALERLAGEVGPRILAVEAAGNLAVVRPAPGEGAPTARAVEAAGLPQVVAALHCDDAVLIVARSPADARRVAAALRRAARAG